jgi:hypothetical protein
MNSLDEKEGVWWIIHTSFSRECIHLLYIKKGPLPSI